MRSIAGRRGAAVQAGEDQVPGLRRRQRQADGLGVAHLADQQDVGILAQGVAQAGGEIAHVRADLALAHQPAGALRPDQVLDRILERHQHPRPRVRSACWTSAASVVLLPQPVGPQAMTRPCGRSVSASICAGQVQLGAARGASRRRRRTAAHTPSALA